LSDSNANAGAIQWSADSSWGSGSAELLSLEALGIPGHPPSLGGVIKVPLGVAWRARKELILWYSGLDETFRSRQRRVQR